VIRLPGAGLLCVSAFFALPLGAGEAVWPGPRSSGEIQLPSGRLLTPAGTQVPVGPYPFALSVTPDGRRVVVASMGVSDQTLQLLDARSGRLLSSVPVDGSWLGMVLSPAGDRVYVSGANRNVVLSFRIEGNRLVADRRIPLGGPGDETRNTLPSGLAVSPDGRFLWVARVHAGDVVKLDLETEAIVARVQVGRAPYRPVLSRDGRHLAVALWGGAAVALLDPAKASVVATVPTADHPCDVVFSPDGAFLFVAQANRNLVALLDVGARKVVRQVSVALGPDGPGSASAGSMPDGSTPNALALSPDGETLFVANADDDAVAVVDVDGPPDRARAVGFVPVGWYPAALALTPDGRTLFVANAKGSGSRSNAKDGPDPTREASGDAGHLKRMPGSVSRVPVPSPSRLRAHTERAYRNRKPSARGVSPARASSVVPLAPGVVSPIRNVLYVIRENRTYDQVFGDLERGNGDPSLTVFGREVTPNAHALVDEFVLFDNFYADAEVSADGHNWSMAGYATDYTEKTWVPCYGGLGFPYDYEGGDPIASPTAGYLWDAAARKGLSVRNYGEFVGLSPENPGTGFDGRYEGRGDVLRGNTCPFFPGFDMDILDNTRVDLWLREFRAFLAKRSFPRLSIVRLGNDHTVGTKRGAKTPRAMVADNDLALGRLVEAVSTSPIWKETAIFVVEDDAQNGPDHVDSHRTLALVISPYTRRGGAVDSTLYSTTSMLRTMELILGLPPLSQHDAAATPMTNAFRDDPDPTPFRHLPVPVDLYETNPDGAPMQADCDSWDFTREDATPEIPLNEAIWKSVRGRDAVMPPPVNAAFVTPAGREED
jgi:DNA-binding beta-propeller fold protein YncE